MYIISAELCLLRESKFTSPFEHYKYHAPSQYCASIIPIFMNGQCVILGVGLVYRRRYGMTPVE